MVCAPCRERDLTNLGVVHQRGVCFSSPSMSDFNGYVECVSMMMMMMVTGEIGYDFARNVHRELDN